MKQHAAKAPAKKPAKKRITTVGTPEAKPLSDGEFDELEKLMEDAHLNDEAVLSQSKRVNDARLAVASAQDELRAAENGLRTACQWNRDALSKLAPLLHRLPVVEG